MKKLIFFFEILAIFYPISSYSKAPEVTRYVIYNQSNKPESARNTNYWSPVTVHGTGVYIGHNIVLTAAHVLLSLNVDGKMYTEIGETVPTPIEVKKNDIKVIIDGKLFTVMGSRHSTLNIFSNTYDPPTYDLGVVYLSGNIDRIIKPSVVCNADSAVGDVVQIRSVRSKIDGEVVQSSPSDIVIATRHQIEEGDSGSGVFMDNGCLVGVMSFSNKGENINGRYLSHAVSTSPIRQAFTLIKKYNYH